MLVISAKVKSNYWIWLKMKKAAIDDAAFLPPNVTLLNINLK